MNLKVKRSTIIIYNVILVILTFMFYKMNITSKIIRYISFETIMYKFQDLLSISITILIVFVGAIITVATVLISMCDKRIIRLIAKNNKTSYLVSCIKTSIVTGLIIIVLLAIMYARIDFNIFIIRIIILYIVGYLMIIFTAKSKLLIVIILSILNESFKEQEQDSFRFKPTFKNPNDKTNKKE
ncbi:hypothetical protein [Clostridium sp. FP1]|uniref:hypothetical protein n=1 Tax=Clostridium sp. FP1 TaxID=2724076 RepID=UPI0013E928B9|nr:hypothetical protein [Clostridium sp. FP1]MBZ9633214.1 hypothetical protein [Clostridium sp. FP1]